VTSEVFAIVAPVLLGAALGFAWARFGPHFNTELLTSLVLVIGTPCLIFSTLTRFAIDSEAVGEMALSALASLAVIFVVGSGLLLVTRQPVRTFLPSLLFPNAGNMGLPLCLFAFGDQGLALGIVFFTVTSLGNFTLGVWLASGEISPWRLFQTPLIWAAAAGVIFLTLGVKPPLWLANTTKMIGDFTIPAILIALGVALAQMKVGSLGRAVWVGVLRMALGLTIGLTLAELFQFEDVARGVIILQCTMPVAVYNYLFAQRYGDRPSEVAGAVVVSTALSFLTLPFLIVFVLM
jgi:predicted permease